MPYIKQIDRNAYDLFIERLVDTIVNSKFVIAATQNAIQSLLLNAYSTTLPCYADYNEIVGVLECSKLEFIRLGHKVPLLPLKFKKIGKIEKESLEFRGCQLVKQIDDWFENNCQSIAGQLNYIITRTLLLVSKSQLSDYSPVGILESVKLNLYAVDVVPYEKKKAKENGEVATTFLG